MFDKILNLQLSFTWPPNEHRAYVPRALLANLRTNNNCRLAHVLPVLLQALAIINTSLFSDPPA